MRLLCRIPLLALFVLICSSFGFAQRYCEIPPPSPFHHSAEITTALDKRANAMRTVMQYPRQPGKNGEGFYLAASFLHQDFRLQTVPTVDLYFTVVSEAKEFEHAHDVKLLVNGQGLAFVGPVQYASTKDHGVNVETTKVTVTYETLSQIIKARSVETRIGPTSFHLSNNNLEALREVASLIEPYTRNHAQFGPKSAVTTRTR